MIGQNGFTHTLCGVSGLELGYRTAQIPNTSVNRKQAYYLEQGYSVYILISNILIGLYTVKHPTQQPRSLEVNIGSAIELLRLVSPSACSTRPTAPDP
ncbi:hypothetical protein RRG08_044474 [Elysia crispata]|uniref:Uncharacterized protein n=1 Tax=Elysia crispata TaxID=231223 RepID=A0AAE1D786_9GAST|nr:hypothetical protein RRG08_044474 [Elysia crispata]